MTIEDIKKNIYREDKMITAVNCETSENTINAIIRGSQALAKDPNAVLTNERNPNTVLGKAIIKELTRLAKINMKSKTKKQAA